MRCKFSVDSGILNEGSRVSSIWEDCRGNQIAQGTDQIMVYISAPLILDKYEKEEAL